MFDSQIQKYYYDLYNIEYEYYTVKEIANTLNTIRDYELIACETKQELRKYDNVSEIKKLITIIDNNNINSIGDDFYSLSSTWFKKHSSDKVIGQFRKHILNYFTNINKSKSNKSRRESNASDNKFYRGLFNFK